MVQKKSDGRSKNWMTEMLDRLDKDHPIVSTKWAVEEVTPGYTDSGYYGDVWHQEESVIVSPEFDSREEAEAWMDRHEADKDKFLAIAKLTAREYRQVHWTKIRISK